MKMPVPSRKIRTYLGDELRHEFDDARVITKSPQQHDYLLHGNFFTSIVTQDIIYKAARQVGVRV